MKAIDYFKELNKIPRGSFNEQKVAQYLCDFAEKKGLKYKIDKLFNVKVFKDNGSSNTIILQAHTDMVCEKLKSVNFNFETDAIQTEIENDFISAKGTTLGADDGFGVSLILETLENCGKGYPNIEAVFTSQEESGMGGAKFIDVSDLKGKYLLGLDGTSSEELIISCAGSCRLDFEKSWVDCEVEEKDNNLKIYKLDISGLLGGHSGEDIDKGRANANIVGCEILKNISIKPLKIVKICGGGKDNAIPREFVAIFKSGLDLQEIEKIIEDYKTDFIKQFPNELNAVFNLCIIEENKNLKDDNDFSDEDFKKCIKDCKALSVEDSKDLIDFVINFKNGVLENDADGQVICSINLANVKMENCQLMCRTMLRFNISRVQSNSLNKFTLYANAKKYKCILRDSSPFFEVSNKKDLIDLAVNSYNQCGFKNLKVMQIHAGLEGGIFAEKISNLQVVVLGADLYDIHTPKEKMKISSLEKLSMWIKQIMQNMQKQ